jgi:uncharacterized membrane protein
MRLPGPDALERRIWLARPNCSLSAKANQTLLFAVAGISGLIALVFTLFGAWLIIPFTGAELAVLWWALKQVADHADDFERITLEHGQLTVETRHGACIEHRAYPAYWLQLDYLTQPRWRANRLLIRAYGKETEIGSLLTEEQKVALAKVLREKLGSQLPVTNTEKEKT